MCSTCWWAHKFRTSQNTRQPQTHSNKKHSHLHIKMQPQSMHICTRHYQWLRQHPNASWELFKLHITTAQQRISKIISSHLLKTWQNLKTWTKCDRRPSKFVTTSQKSRQHVNHGPNTSQLATTLPKWNLMSCVTRKKTRQHSKCTRTCAEPVERTPGEQPTSSPKHHRTSITEHASQHKYHRRNIIRTHILANTSSHAEADAEFSAKADAKSKCLAHANHHCTKTLATAHPKCHVKSSVELIHCACRICDQGTRLARRNGSRPRMQKIAHEARRTGSQPKKLKIAHLAWPNGSRPKKHKIAHIARRNGSQPTKQKIAHRARRNGSRSATLSM